MLRKSLVIIMITLLASCGGNGTNGGDDREYRLSDAGDTIYIERTPDGILQKEITVKNGKKHGLTWEHYPDGTVKEITNYINGEKEGISKWYYDNGQLYLETPYKNDKIEGIRKKYSRDGMLIAEIPYSEGLPQPGTREYKKPGVLYDDYPEILFFWDDKRSHQNIYRIRMYLSDKTRNVHFYYFKDENGKKTRIGLPVGYNGIGDLEFRVMSLDELPDSIRFYSEYETPRGNPKVLSDSYILPKATFDFN